MASAGIIPGVLTCISSGGIAAFGLYLLSCCAARAPHRKSSFFAISQLTFPSASVFFDAAIAIKCFGVSIRRVIGSPRGAFWKALILLLSSYLIIIRGLVPQVVRSLYYVLAPDTAPPHWMLDGRIWISFIMLFLIPLCFFRRLDSLRHTSYVALFSVGPYLMFIGRGE
jgi:amino acid permease